MGVQGGPNIVLNGLTFSVDAASNRSYPGTGTMWYDLSGNWNNATYRNNTSFVTFQNKKAFRLNNNGLYVYNSATDGFNAISNPGISASGTSFTFESWFYQTTANAGQTVILSNAGGCDGYRWGPQGTSTYWLLGNSDCSQYAEGGVGNYTTTVGRWVQMVGIFDRANTLGGGTKFYNYINGVAEGNASTYNPTIQTGGPMIPGNCCGAFDGYLSIIRIYNRALTQSEITQNFNAERNYFGI